jgi:peptide chain release factor
MRMIVQISSGDGPAECQLAVEKLVESLQGEISGLTVVSRKPGSMNIGLKSARVSSEADISFLEGTVEWICPSPVRPNHKRKNWSIDVSVIRETEESFQLSRKDVILQTFRSSGHGGQNVHKVETGVRAVHLPSGVFAVSTDDRSQLRNKEIALERLEGKLKAARRARAAEIKGENRLAHTRLARGNPIRIYRGPDFRREL